MMECKRGRRGTHIKYNFIALDGKRRAAEFARSIEGLREGEPIAVLYKTLEPEVSRPVAGFIFCSFISLNAGLTENS